MDFKELDVKDFQNAVTDQRLMQLRLIVGGLALGPILFGIIAGIMSKEAKEIEVLSYMNYGMATLALCGSLVVPGIILNKVKPFGDSGKDLANLVLDKIQSVTIVRFAIAEGAALFGGVCVYIGLGPLHYLSFLPLLINMVLFFPTKKCLLKLFIIKILKDERLLESHPEI